MAMSKSFPLVPRVSARRLGAEAYKSRRVGAAVRGGFTRLGVEGTSAQKKSLSLGLSKLWDKQMGKPCPLLCGRKLTPRRAAFCHNTALANDGAHTLSNIYMACSSCNKSQRTLCRDEYLRVREVLILNFGDELWQKVKKWLAGSRF